MVCNVIYVQIWQHTDCMRVKGDEDNYLCDQCEPRPIDRVWLTQDIVELLSAKICQHYVVYYEELIYAYNLQQISTCALI